MKDFRFKTVLFFGALLMMLSTSASIYAQDPVDIYCGCDSVYVNVTSYISEEEECCFTIHSGINNNNENCPMYPYHVIKDSATGTVLGTGYNSTGNTVTLCNITSTTLIIDYYTALPPGGVVHCSKVVQLPPCPSCECEDFTVTKIVSVPPAVDPNCCFDVQINAPEICEIFSVTIDDITAQVGKAYLTNGGQPLSFPILYEDLCGGVNGSGVFRFTFRDSFGSIVCEKEISYNCNPVMPRQGSNRSTGEDVKMPLPVEEILLNLNPNPSNGEVNISFTLASHSDVKIEVYNSTGDLIEVIKNGHLEKGVQMIKHLTSNYAIGAYQVRLSVNNAIYTIPLIISR